MNYYKKYLKYKKKYMILKNIKNQKGGEILIPCERNLALNNRIGSCWNASIQMIFIFSDITKDTVQSRIMLPNDEILATVHDVLRSSLPFDFFVHDNYRNTFKDDIYKFINMWITTLRERFTILLTDSGYAVETRMTHVPLDESEVYEAKTELTLKSVCVPDQHELKLQRASSLGYEKIFTHNIFNLINTNTSQIGGRGIDTFFLILLFSIFYYGRLIDFTIYPLYVSSKINFDNPLNSYYKKTTVASDVALGTLIETIENSIGILFYFNKHICSFYKCNKIYKYYDSYRPLVPVIVFDLIGFITHIIQQIQTNIPYYIFQLKNESLFNYPMLSMVSFSPFIINNNGDIVCMGRDDKMQKINIGLSPYEINNIIKKLLEDDNIFKFVKFTVLSDYKLSHIEYFLKYKSNYLDYYILNKQINLDILNNYYKKLHERVPHMPIRLPSDIRLEPKLIHAGLSPKYNYPYIYDKIQLEEQYNLYNYNIIYYTMTEYMHNGLNPRLLYILEEKYPDININAEVGPSGYTHLINAMIEDYQKFPQSCPITSILLKRNDININYICEQTRVWLPDTYIRWTPLLYAISKEHIILIHMIMSYNSPFYGRCNINMPAGNNNYTPLVFAIKTRTNNNDIIIELLNNGADINIHCGINNITPLIAAIETNNTEISLRLIREGANINLTGGINNYTPLVFAIKTRTNNNDIIIELLNNGADINIHCGINNITPLIAAIETNNTEISLRLIREGANINIRVGVNNTTPLIAAIEIDNTEIIETLLHYADLNMFGNNITNTPLGVAIKKRNLNIIPFLFDNSVHNYSKLLIAVMLNDINLVNEMINEDNANINTLKGPKNTTPLLTAINNNNSDIVRLLLNKGADIDKVSGEYNVTPLLAATNLRHRNIIEILLANGADVNIQSGHDMSVPLKSLLNNSEHEHIDMDIINLLIPELSNKHKRIEPNKIYSIEVLEDIIENVLPNDNNNAILIEIQTLLLDKSMPKEHLSATKKLRV
jgi:ankyrin repeat protein